VFEKNLKLSVKFWLLFGQLLHRTNIIRLKARWLMADSGYIQLAPAGQVMYQLLWNIRC